MPNPPTLTQKRISIGNGAGFLGDNLDAPRRLVEGARLDYLTLEYLAELTMSILARLRQKDPQAGYANDFLEVLASLLPALQAQPQLKIVTNAGGVNPLSCAQHAAKILGDAGLASTLIGIVTGDDLLPRLATLQQQGHPFANMDTGEPLSTLTAPIVSANAYLGAKPISDALAGGARIVITGRVADASLTVGPAVHEFGWSWDDLPRLAAASVAGHIIECGAQATGGLYRGWPSLHLADVGYPIAELNADGEIVITKPAGSGGTVGRSTVAEQIVYEIGDPRHYLTPDVDVDFSAVALHEVGPNRVSVWGAGGNPAPSSYKVSLAYQAGYTASGQLLVYGHDCIAKAQACAEIILQRLARAGFQFERTHVETLGSGAGVSGVHSPPEHLREVMLRLTVADDDRGAVERFTKEFAPLITSGPPGLAGYASGRPSIRPMFAYWPTTVPKDLIEPQVRVATAGELAAELP